MRLTNVNGITNIWRRLFDRLLKEPTPPYGIMRWDALFADEEGLVELAREAHDEAERGIRERQERRNARNPKIQSGDGQDSARRSEDGESRIGSRETS